MNDIQDWLSIGILMEGLFKVWCPTQTYSIFLWNIDKG